MSSRFQKDEPFHLFLSVLLGLVVVGVVASLAALALVCANPYEPRLQGKHAVLTRLANAEGCGRHVLPFAWAGDLAAAEREAGALGFPLVVKPNALTSCALGVHAVVDGAHMTERLGQLLPLLHSHKGGRGAKDTKDTEWGGVVLQQYYGGPCIEARLYGVQRRDGSWAWDPVVHAAAPAIHAVVAQTPMSAVLQRELERVMAAAFPDMHAVAMDVRAPSLTRLQEDADFAILEVNGTFGVAHTWRGHGSLVASTVHMAGDLVRWFFPRLGRGVVNAVTGRVDVGERVAQEWAWVWAAHGTLQRVQTRFAPDPADLI